MTTKFFSDMMPRLLLAMALVAPSGSWAQSATSVLDRLRLNGENMSAYYPLGSRRAGLMVNTVTGQKVSQWSTRPTGPDSADITWGDPAHWPSPAGQPITVEEWSIKTNCAGGRAFVWLNAFRNDYAQSTVRNRFRLETTRAELRVGDGPWVDITAGGSCGTDGHPYALNDVTIDPYGLRVWGNIHNADGLTVGTRFFWQETISYVAAADNSCWRSGPPGARAAIRQEETWWDSRAGWSIGRGENAGAAGEPNGENVVYGRWQLIGRGVGPGWREEDAAEKLCLQQTWPW